MIKIALNIDLPVTNSYIEPQIEREDCLEEQSFPGTEKGSNMYLDTHSTAE